MAKIDTGDTAWLLVSSALVLLMTPALALFYGGHGPAEERALHAHALVRGDPDREHPVGALRLLARVRRRPCRGSSAALDFVGLTGVAGARPRHRAAPRVRRVPDDVRGDHAGAHLRRVRRADEVLGVRRLHRSSGRRSSTTRSRTGSGPRAAGSLKMGALDFAGGTVVHLTAGVSALVCALVIGKRARLPAASSRSRTTSR